MNLHDVSDKNIWIVKTKKDSIRMMWLAQGYEPSYRTINRFRVQPEVKKLIGQCFVQFRCQLVQEKIIDQEAIFIDGTGVLIRELLYDFIANLQASHKNIPYV